MAEVAATAAQQQWPAWRWRRQLGRSAMLAVAAACLEVQQQRGGSGGNNTVLVGAAWCMLTITAMVTMTTMIDY